MISFVTYDDFSVILSSWILFHKRISNANLRFFKYFHPGYIGQQTNIWLYWVIGNIVVSIEKFICKFLKEKILLLPKFPVDVWILCDHTYCCKGSIFAVYLSSKFLGGQKCMRHSYHERLQQSNGIFLLPFYWHNKLLFCFFLLIQIGLK